MISRSLRTRVVSVRADLSCYCYRMISPFRLCKVLRYLKGLFGPPPDEEVVIYLNQVQRCTRRTLCCCPSITPLKGIIAIHDCFSTLTWYVFLDNSARRAHLCAVMRKGRIGVIVRPIIRAKKIKVRVRQSEFWVPRKTFGNMQLVIGARCAQPHRMDCA